MIATVGAAPEGSVKAPIDRVGVASGHSLTAMHVVVIDDETRLVELVVAYLRESGHRADGFVDGVSGLEAARDPDVDAVVLDLMLPGLNGIEVCRALRGELNDVPILMLTARGTVRERITGLDAGADDYLVKPFSLDELSARLRAVQRRRPASDHRVAVGDLLLDALEQRVWRADVELDLTRREFAVLQALMDNAGRVVSRTYLLDEVWDDDIDIRSNAIEVHISKLRTKIDTPSGTGSITTLRGTGYRMETRP